MTRVFIAEPVRYPPADPSRHERASRSARVCSHFAASSLLPLNCNLLWAQALITRPWSELVMIHHDVEPLDPFWVDWLVCQRRRLGADILSVVLPFADGSEQTSTAVKTQQGPRRLTLAEAHALPEFFNLADCGREGLPGSALLVNTGLFVCGFDRPWVERIHFRFRDAIRRIGNNFVAECMPEDWNFSLRAARLGLSVWATTALPARHGGHSNQLEAAA